MADITGKINDGSMTGTIYAGGNGGGASIKYTLTKVGSEVILEGSDGSKSKIADANTTYTLSVNEAGKIVLEGSDGMNQDIDVTDVADKVISAKFVSVAKLPDSPDENTFYFIQGD